jgi:hypothetical protein
VVPHEHGDNTDDKNQEKAILNNEPATLFHIGGDYLGTPKVRIF